MLSIGSGKFFNLIGIILAVFASSYILGLALGGGEMSFIFAVITVVGSIVIWLLFEILNAME